MNPKNRPDVVVILTDEERAAPPYESKELAAWRQNTLTGRKWFDENGVSFDRHYTGSLACVPSRPTLFTGQYPDVHGATQTDGLAKLSGDSRMRWLQPGEVPTLGHWFRAAGYDTHYDGKWHMSHADLTDPLTGKAIATNSQDGEVLPAAVRAYLDADPLNGFGFSGWVGPEPHGAAHADCGLIRDPLIAERVVAWLENRYAGRRAGDADALRPFLLVASFVNPHDIVLFPAWVRSSPLSASPDDPPHVAEAPTAQEDLHSKPASQIAYRESYYSAYGPPAAVERIYRRNSQQYRDLYYRLHVEVDAPLDRVRRAVTDGGSENAVLVRSSDHGDLLGAHGGLHQKWFNLYDEATRVPFTIVRTGIDATVAGRIKHTPTSHVDMIPTLLSAAGINQDQLSTELAQTFSEVHPLPGRDLTPLLKPGAEDSEKTSHSQFQAVYLMTRDNVLEGDSSASGLARRLGLEEHARGPLAISVPAYVGANFEGIVAVVTQQDCAAADGHMWKLVRSFDDPTTWTTPGVRHLSASGPGGPRYRTEPLADQWELYNLNEDPNEEHNLWATAKTADIQEHLCVRLEHERSRCVPKRNRPWVYDERHPDSGPERQLPPLPARFIRRAIHKLGMHPDDPTPFVGDLSGRRALIVCTNHGTLDIGKATGVYSSEMTAPYYAFLDAGMQVDLASPLGGSIPVDPQSLMPVLRCDADDRFLADPALRAQVGNSLAIGTLNMDSYDLVYLAGGWGAAFDFGESTELAEKITDAAAQGLVIGGVCHGPLGLRNAVTAQGRPLVEGRKISAVTDKQVHELGIESTPQHPETELRKMGALFESSTRFRDPFANHWVVDGNLVTGQNQNAGPMVAREMMRLLSLEHSEQKAAGE
ncbi:MAG: sulfatase-like hydrolase/transferase [Microthrixaceae bacterium]